ncbi:MAG: cell division protein ZapA [Candidatus Latescibacteria bacterium]|nr:cell division protein ZapA [Candidatus Latescibacterota bacterium]
MAPEPFVTVTINNQTYRISKDQANTEYIEQVASYLDRKMQAAAKAGARRPVDIALLAALEVATEVLEARQKKDNLLSATDEQISNFSSLLEKQTGSSKSASDTTDDAPSQDSPQTLPPHALSRLKDLLDSED